MTLPPTPSPRPLNATEEKALGALRSALVTGGSAGVFERLVAHLFSALTGVPVIVAKAGYQFGADAGTAGRHLRQLRIECKRYSKSTELNERELLGEISEALSGDTALETWILATTQQADETLRRALTEHGAKAGLPILFIDWSRTEAGLPDLAALCAGYPEIVAHHYAGPASDAAAELAGAGGPGLVRLRRDLQSWMLGFEALRETTHDRLEKIWNEREESWARLGQDAAGGLLADLIFRKKVATQLDAWWSGPRENPGIVIGMERVGKTMAVLRWLIDCQDSLPILLVIPAAEVRYDLAASASGVLDFLGSHLAALTFVRDGAYWRARLERLLARPLADDPPILLILDGLNEMPSVPWSRIGQILQADPFRGRIRLLLTARSGYYHDRLQTLQSDVVSPPRTVVVDPFDTMPGGELDQILALNGLTRADLGEELVQLAGVAGFFRLVMQARTSDTLRTDPTVYRLLWEYGCNTLHTRANYPFTAASWQEFLVKLARTYRDELQTATAKGRSSSAATVRLEDVVHSAGRPDLSPDHLARRLSEIVDGGYLVPVAGKPGAFRIEPKATALSLAVALHSELSGIVDPVILEETFVKWWEPIAALDEATEVLRAAVSVAVAQGDALEAPIMSLLVRAWLNSQNRPEHHLEDVTVLAYALVPALIDTIDASRARAQADARDWAWASLRCVPSDHSGSRAIYEALARWCASVSTGRQRPGNQAGEEPWESRQLRDRLGTAEPGEYLVFGQKVTVTNSDDSESVAHEIPAFLFGQPLAKAEMVFQAVAIRRAIQPVARSWEGFRWLVLLNSVDRSATVAAIKAVGTRVRATDPPTGLSPDLGRRVAAMLLFLTGTEDAELEASQLMPKDVESSYEARYLKDPAHTFYSLEFRHAPQVLAANDIPLFRRAQRIEDFVAYPKWVPPESFTEELRSWARAFPVETLDRHGGMTSEDHEVRVLEPVLARFLPDELAAFMRSKLAKLPQATADQRYWAGISAPQHLLLVQPPHNQAAHELRLLPTANDCDSGRESYLQSCLLAVELAGVPVERQLSILADEQSGSGATVITPPTSTSIREFAATHDLTQPRAAEVLLHALYEFPLEIDKAVFDALLAWHLDASDSMRVLAFAALSSCAPQAFGEVLHREGWRWDHTHIRGLDHFAAAAFIRATKDKPFSDILPRVPPGNILDVVRERGNRPAEVRAAAEYLSQILEGGNPEPPPAHLMVDHADTTGRALVSIAPREPAGDLKAALTRMTDSSAMAEAANAAVAASMKHIDQLRHAGAVLYLVSLDKDDLGPIIEFAPEQIARWLEGMEENGLAFRSRLHRAEGLYLALCEALLVNDPMRGATLWERLGDMHITHNGIANVDERIHLLFRLPENAQVLSLRDAVIGLGASNTDKALLDVVIAARAGGSLPWLDRTIAGDEAASEDWRRKRAIVMRGFAHPKSMSEIAWPEGDRSGTSWEAVRERADAWARNESSPATGGANSLRPKRRRLPMRRGSYS